MLRGLQLNEEEIVVMSHHEFTERGIPLEDTEIEVDIVKTTTGDGKDDTADVGGRQTVAGRPLDSVSLIFVSSKNC